MTASPAPNAAEHLARLIAFPTVSAVSNLDLLEYVEATAAPHGARIRRFPNDAGDKASILVSIGPEAPGGIVLSGHTDVVPTEGQAWTGDPWTMREQGGRLIGRGATDMKGFLACCLAALPTFEGLARPIHLAFSYDEEVGCTGVWDMARWIGGSGLAPRLALIGEPSSMDLIAAHKTGLIGWTTVTGKPGHSSQPDRYVNAVMVAAELVAEINRIRAEMRESGPRLEGLDPPWSTIQVNQIAGGLHGNIVAESCRFFWEMRVVPGADDQAVLARMQAHARSLEPAMHAVDPSTGISIDVLSRIPGLAPNGDAALEGDVLKLLGRDAARLVAYGTEAGIFQEFGVPALVAGPGDVADAHQPDESIARSELDACVAFLGRLAETLR